MTPQTTINRSIQGPWQGRDLLKIALIFLVTFAAYLPAVKNGYIWDDDSYVTGNTLLLTLDGLWKIWFSTETPQYYPLVFTTFWVEQHLWGLAPAGYHATNILLHAMNSTLVWLILRRLDIKGGLFIGLLFALHPVHVESVAWITERKNVLSGLFYLSALLSFLSYEERAVKRHYILSIVFFSAALMSKTVTSTLPAVILILRWMQGKRIDLRYVRLLLPFFAIGFAMSLVTIWWEAKIVGAEGAAWEMGIAERLMLPGRIAFFYAYKLLAPMDLTFIYPRWRLDPADASQWLWSIALAITLAVLWALKGRIGRRPFAGAAFFVLTLLPALGFFKVYPFQYSFVADHFQYLASLGVLSVAGGLVFLAFENTAEWGRPVKTAVLTAVLVALGVLTWNQNHIYRDAETLWRDTISKNPGAFMAHTNLATILYGQGRNEEAFDHNLRALAAKPDSANARYNIGLIFFKEGRVEEAIAQYRLAIGSDPGHVMARISLGKLLADEGRLDEALVHYKKALELVPDQVMTHNNIATVYAKKGQIDKAIEHLRHVLKINPDYTLARQNLGTILLRTGMTGEAVEHFRRILDADPANANAYNGIGEALLAEGRRPEAEAYFRKAIEADPRLEKARANLKEIGG
ncbi:MAG: hypothetical protein A2X99_03260 [Deltaproteobacteria bacterium GWB2_55_19]|nr:MAG: hypothetical protein A2X99_03260 [Deltaproteobacteria bacterium GWB2_55_19]HAO94392.1 O-GlcNAc transferase [Deltaproteobacteria bacterium]